MIAAEYAYKICMNIKRIITNKLLLLEIQMPNRISWIWVLPRGAESNTECRRQGIREKVLESELFLKYVVKDENAYVYLLPFPHWMNCRELSLIFSVSFSGLTCGLLFKWDHYYWRIHCMRELQLAWGRRIAKTGILPGTSAHFMFMRASNLHTAKRSSTCSRKV